MTIQEFKALAVGQVVQYKGMQIPSAHGGLLLDSPAGAAKVKSAQSHYIGERDEYFSVCIVLPDAREAHLMMIEHPASGRHQTALEAALAYYAV